MKNNEKNNHYKLLLIIAAITAALMLGRIAWGASNGLTVRESFMTKQQLIDSWISSGSMDRTDANFEH